ncbi:MAG: hypothetical protein JO316_08005 [Abitibacteriaceae bacterium]|nr:hypothetical protein [Abditibacteriaceae bacterium]MBV9865276.1 hypothetical protein [Abditibacteriaceae bacterium]
MRQWLKTTPIISLLLMTVAPVLAAETEAPDETQTPAKTQTAPDSPAAPDSQNAPEEAAANDTRTGDIQNVTSGKAMPLTLKLKDLGGNWRQLTISSEIETDKKIGRELNNTLNRTDPDEEMQTLVSLLASGPGVYFTQGQTVTTGNDSFLVAYHAQFDPQEFKALFKEGDKEPTPDEVTQLLEDYLRERTLDLSLLNLRQVGSMSNIRPFNFQDQVAKVRAFVTRSYAAHKASTGTDEPPSAAPPPAIATPRHNAAQAITPVTPMPPVDADAARANAINGASMDNLRELGAALKNYIEDNDDTLPPMKDAATAKAALKPYGSESVFVHPATKEAYRPNPVLSIKKLAHITNPAAMVAFFEANATPDGRRALLFLDGHVKRIKEAEWPQVKRASKIP